MFDVIDFERAKVILVCSHGYLNQQFMKTVDELLMSGYATIRENRSKFLCLHTASGGIQALKVFSECKMECRKY